MSVDDKNYVEVNGEIVMEDHHVLLHMGKKV